MFGLVMQSAVNVLLFGLLIGAGLPTLFALGTLGLAYGKGAHTATENAAPGGLRPVATVLGYLCFALVIFGIVVGLMTIIASGMNMKVTFDHIIPMMVKK